ncbi:MULTISPECIES: hypothetical protein [Pseudomonas]|uniref:hypothetical protein n=1 Tax=Pseudomonas TaxID=286 RepID=UPI0008F17448|nr:MULTISPECIES: hypothetical protein [Pseudomonas]SFU17962.1 hypothetical protein SAMN05216264_11865 [Pseudomonas marincola]
MAANRWITLQQAVGDPLGIPLARHPSLRNAVNTLVKALAKAELITLQQDRFEYSASEKKRLSLNAADRTCLVNAVLLQGVFAEPKIVIKLFTDSAMRVTYSAWAKTLLIDQQSKAGQGFLPSRLIGFLDILAGNDDLKTELLPNPFSDTLPQMGIGPTHCTSLLHLAAVQAAALSQGYIMMAYYLNGDIEKAYQAALEVRGAAPALEQYRDLIIRDYRDSRAVKALLDDWR